MPLQKHVGTVVCMCGVYRLRSSIARLSLRHLIAAITTTGRLIPGRVGVL